MPTQHGCLSDPPSVRGSLRSISSSLFLQKTSCYSLETEAASSGEETGKARAPRHRDRFQQRCIAGLNDLQILCARCMLDVFFWIELHLATAGCTRASFQSLRAPGAGRGARRRAGSALSAVSCAVGCELWAGRAPLRATSCGRAGRRSTSCAAGQVSSAARCSWTSSAAAVPSYVRCGFALPRELCAGQLCTSLFCSWKKSGVSFYKR